MMAHHGHMAMGDYPLWLSALIAGLVGSAAHCSVMCSPIVAAQMFELKEKNDTQWRMAAYHAGRVTVYALLGALAFFAGRATIGGRLADASQILLVVAGALFVASAVLPQKTHRCCSEKTRNLTAFIAKFVKGYPFYYLRGLLMGFVPCGMIVSALALAASASGALAAAGAMAVFALATVPALQTAGFAALFLGRRFPAARAKVGRTLMAANGLALCAIGLGIISIH
ncbi:MAG: sulfite exporter TauE/SafE family protein [Rickettsiales bacterium]